ncbi:MAG: Putative ABC transporter maltose-binding protein [Microgenomates bacterium 39_7]|nr:MAG: Putative ABC transporter maltose-binding protein [Microgenomates bacterium 39_7]
MYDGLGLYYNKDILRTANEEVPVTWGEVRVLADKLTVRSGNEVERGGIALGNTTNVEHFSDILGLLIYQNGGDPTNPISGEVRDAIDFYALFAKSTPVYGTNLPSSTTAFARGDVAMMLAPSWRVHEIKHLNPDLDFGIAPVPKLGESEYGWATYWAEGVSSKSPHTDEAWQLLKYLSSPEVLRKLYSAQSEIRAFGEIYPRVDMADELAEAEYVSAYIQDAPLARSGPLCSFTHDVGLNDSIIDYYADTINKAMSQDLSQNDLQTLNQGVSQVLNQYGL